MIYVDGWMCMGVQMDNLELQMCPNMVGIVLFEFICSIYLDVMVGTRHGTVDWNTGSRLFEFNFKFFFDMWTSINMKACLAVTRRYVKDDNKLSTAVLQLLQFPVGQVSLEQHTLWKGYFPLICVILLRNIPPFPKHPFPMRDYPNAGKVFNKIKIL